MAALLAQACGHAAASKQAPKSPAELIVETRWHAKGKVEAVGMDGSLVVQRGETIDVYTATGKLSGSLPLGNPEDMPGYRYAVSSGAKRVAFTARNGMIALWDVPTKRRLWRASAASALEIARPSFPMVGPAPVAPASWGPPRFLGDGRFVTHHSGGIVVWDPATGRASSAVSDESMGIVRSSAPLGPDQLIVRCGSNHPDIANSAPFVVSLKEKRIVQRIRPDRHSLRRVGRVDAWLSDDEQVYLWVKEGETMHKLGLATHPDLLTISPDGSRIAWVEQPWGEHAGVVNVLSRKTGRLLRRELEDDVRLAWLHADGSTVHSVSAEGAVRGWAIPTFDGASRAELVAVVDDPREDTWQHALVAFGRGDLHAASEMTSSFRKRGVPAKYQLAARYAFSQAQETGRDEFLAACKMAGIDLNAASAQHALIALAEDFSQAQLVLGVDFIFYWLAYTSPGKEPARAAALRISSELSMQLGESDQNGLQRALLINLAERFPDEPFVAEELAELQALEENLDDE